MVHDTGGNPLALLELPTGLSSEQLQGGVAAATTADVDCGVERAFLDRCRRQSKQVQTLLLVAAADATGQAATVRRAAATSVSSQRHGTTPNGPDCSPVTGDAVAVRHPLVRSAVYQAATSYERRQVHRALADAVVTQEPDRATWHRAAAADGPDPDVARALENMAARAEQRGGHLAAAAAYERSAALTASESNRAATAVRGGPYRLGRGAGRSGQGTGRLSPRPRLRPSAES